jgi:heme exporter protein A
VVVEDSVQMANELSHFIGHLEAVKGALTVGENLDFGRKLLGGGGIEIDAALKKLGIGSLIDVPAQILSAGQKRRLALARLLVATRPLWLLDEPTTALDSEGQRTVIQLIGEHRASGGLVIVATHMALDLSGAREIVLTGEGVA